MVKLEPWIDAPSRETADHTPKGSRERLIKSQYGGTERPGVLASKDCYTWMSSKNALERKIAHAHWQSGCLVAETLKTRQG